MKKNKRLLYTLGNIPEKFIDESMNEQARKAKIQWKYIITAAACFIVIATLPVYMIRRSVDKGNNDIGTSSEISDVTSAVNTESDTPAPDHTEPEVTAQCKFPGTGSEKPADYTPDRKICCLSSEYNDGVDSNFDTTKGYMQIIFLKDKKFEERINSDIRDAIDSIEKNYDDQSFSNIHFNEGEDLWQMEKIPCQAMDCQNGYLSVIVGYVSYLSNQSSGEGGVSYDNIAVLNYDLIEQKRIEKLTDLFYKGEDVLSLINKTVKDRLDRIAVPDGASLYLKQTLKKEFDGFTEIPQLFTLSDIILSTDNPFFGLAPSLQYRSDGYDDIIDHMIIGKYRDMKDIVDDDHTRLIIDAENFIEWYSRSVKSYEDDLTVCYKEITGSRFHTDEEVSEYNQLSNKIQHIAADFIKNNYSPQTDPELYHHGQDGYILPLDSFDYQPSPYLKNVYTITDSDGFNINIDIVNSKVLSLTDISEQTDTSGIEDIYNWDIAGVENNTVKFGVPETHAQMINRTQGLDSDYIEDQVIIATCNTEDINKEYFNPDYEQERTKENYYY